MIDLGAWAAEAYRLPEAEPSDPSEMADAFDEGDHALRSISKKSKP